MKNILKVYFYLIKKIPVFQLVDDLDINDLFDLFVIGFKDPKFKVGIVRSFISTGCLHMHNNDDSVYQFEPYQINKICGTMQIVPTGTRNDHQMNVDESDIDESDLNENFEVVQAMNAFLDYDSEDEDAMNAVLDL